MAIDSEQKRKSAATIATVWNPPSVVPSGTIAQADRQHIGWSYSGILAGALAAVVRAFLIKNTLLAIASYLQAGGYVPKTTIGEPKSPPGEYLSAAVYMGDVHVAELTLGTDITVHTVMVRFYMQMLQEMTEQIESKLAEVVAEISSDLLGEFDLGATIRNVDAGGIYGSPLQATWGYVDLSGIMYRVVDMAVPLIVDDSATLAA